MNGLALGHIPRSPPKWSPDAANPSALRWAEGKPGWLEALEGLGMHLF